MSSEVSRPRVSAVVVTYFTGPLLARSIDALRKQPDVAEIVIVDNGNWEGVVEAAVGDFDAGPRTQVITGHGNVGFATACNLGQRATTGDVLLFVNPDAILPKGAVAKLIDGASEEERPWLIAPKVVNPNGAEQQGSRRATLTPWRAFVEATKLYRLAPNHPYFRRFNLHDDPCPTVRTALPVISGACFMVMKEDFNAIGGMDERYFLHVEDVDFCLRFAEAGGRVLFEPDVEVLHFKSSSRVNPIGVEMRKTSSMIKYFRAHFSDVYPRPFLWLVSFCLWAIFALKSGLQVVGDALAAIGLRSRRGKAAVRRARSMAAHRSSR